MSQDFEKLGVFYLGTRVEEAAAGAGAAPAADPLLYDARDLTTHALCVGMTGSGKTGLAVGLLEEAAMDGVPVIAVDPKGDLTNLLLTFPGLSPSEFEPWVDPAAAARAGQSRGEFAAATAALWQKGLADSGQPADRVARLRAAADFAVYTPGSEAGRHLSVLRSLAAPPPEQRDDATAMRDRVQSTVSGLLALVGVDADPLRSREHILLSMLVDQTWRSGQDLGVLQLITGVQKPPFTQVGAFDLETFFPARERLGLAMALNNLVASPGFAAWSAGEPLDVQRLLWTPEGRPRVTVLYLAHLSDAERMFFVTVLFNEVLAWMRRQAGTSSLRALLYMDEIQGYFPPVAAPPSKAPMLTLLKQARAFGLGVVLSTQNPVDLDYKGISNCGTWFIGRLQTERDKARVLEGLESAVTAAGGGVDRAALDTMLSALGPRVFLMRNVHEDAPLLFQTRWTMSYLCGPLTLPQVKALAAARPGAAAAFTAAPATAPAAALATPASPATVGAPPPLPNPNAPSPSGGSRPVVPPGVQEWFDTRPGGTLQPTLYASARVHYVDAKAGMDEWRQLFLSAPWPQGSAGPWDAATVANQEPAVSNVPSADARFGPLPAQLSPKAFAAFERELGSYLYRACPLEGWKCPQLKATSKPGESEGDFRARLSFVLREQRDGALDSLRRKYAPKVQALQERLRKAQERVAREQSQLSQQKVQTAVSVGSTILGALFGRSALSVGTVGRAATSARGVARTAREAGDVDRAEEGVDVVRQQFFALQQEISDETARLTAELADDKLTLEALRVAPRKGDTTVGGVALLWRAGPGEGEAR